MQPLIISFFTNDWEYPIHADRLKQECLNFNLPNYIVEKESTKDYIKNTAIKPFFIRECLHEFKRPIFWIDVDALILKPININLGDADFAACVYTNQHINRQWAVASLCFNYTENAIKLLDEWCNNTETGTDEAAFERTWQNMKDILKVQVLPPQYHFVKWSYKIEIPNDTIICHQLSKFEDKLRRKKNGQLTDD